jgi:hypothetical protein
VLATLLLAAGVALAIALGAGWNSPRPSPLPNWRLPSPLLLEVSPPAERTAHLLGWSHREFVAEVVATPRQGSDFNGYGLIFRAQGPEQYAVFAIGSDGYLAVLRVDGEEEVPVLDWQQFPHVRRGRAANRLRLACAADECQFWVNDEYVGSLAADWGDAGQVGFWARRFDGRAVQVSFADGAVWAASW